MCTFGSDFRAAGDGDVAAAATYAAADAGTVRAAGGLQTSGGFVFVGDGELAVAVSGIVARSGGGVLLHTGVAKTTLDSIFPIQLDDHIAVALDFNGSFISTSGVNVHILQGDIGSGTGIRVDGDGVGGGGFIVRLGDDRGVVVFACLTLGDILSVCFGLDADTAVCKVIFCRKGCQGQAANQQQGHHARKNSSQLHRKTSPFMICSPPERGPEHGANTYACMIA